MYAGKKREKHKSFKEKFTRTKIEQNNNTYKHLFITRSIRAK